MGPLENGLYFRRKQQYFSVCSGIFTLIGALTILCIAISVLIDILQRKIQDPEITFQQFNIATFNLPFSYFLEKTQLQFKVKALNTWDQTSEAITCMQFDFDLKYLIPLTGEIL